jgi:uncharacterized membrane protein YuzA (DUF378 family)
VVEFPIPCFGIVLIDFIQGHILGNWSGISPIGRLNDMPIRIAFAMGAALLVSSVAHFLGYPPMAERAKQIIFGGLCGLVTIGSLLGPWVLGKVVYFLIGFVGVISLTFWYRTATRTVAETNTENETGV